MEKRSRGTITQVSSSSDEKHVPTELMHRIQSLLSAKEAARTSVLSKSWLYAWFTIPTLRFPEPGSVKKNHFELMYGTLQRYHNYNIPIEALQIYLMAEYLWFDEIWMRGSQIKELSLEIWSLRGDPFAEFTFSDDILFSGEKLQTIKMNALSCPSINLGINPVIKCVSLRVLELAWVTISEDVLHNLLFTCSLLEKVVLCFCRGLNKTIKVQNLGCLRQLEIHSCKDDGRLEIDNVPSLGLVYYRLCCADQKNLLPFKTTDTTSVTWLRLDVKIIDDTFFDMIKSKFPFLESLTLQIESWASEKLVITSLSLKWLILFLMPGHRPIDLQVYAPNLLFFCYYGKTLPTLLFPTIAPKQIQLLLDLENPLDTSFFLKLREVLNLSSKSDIYIDLSSRHESPFPMNIDDVDDLRKRVLFPVTNVQRVSLKICCLYDRFRELARVFDPFFSICHPGHVKVEVPCLLNEKFFCELTVRGIMETSTTDLKDILKKNRYSGEWEALTSFSETDFVGYTKEVEFKLEWFSHD